MGAWPICTSTAFTQPWYINAIERMDAEERRHVRDLEEQVKRLERDVRDCKTHGLKMRRLKRQLDESEQRLREMVDFYGK